MSELKLPLVVLAGLFSTHRACVNIDESNYIDVAAIILSVSDVERGKLDEIDATGYDIPVLLQRKMKNVYQQNIFHVFLCLRTWRSTQRILWSSLETAASHYETQLRPPFFRALVDYVNQATAHLTAPVIRAANFSVAIRRESVCGILCEALFRADLCNADAAGDPPIHEGAPCIAQKHAAKCLMPINLLVLNGTSSSNKVVLNALLTPGDLVLFDRNNHKSNHHGPCYRLVQHRFIWKQHVTRMVLSVVLMHTASKKVICVN